MTTCTACGTSNRDGLRFCTNCGTSLAFACPACGASLEPGDRFCGSCGRPVAEDSATGASTDPTSTERRVVSILFVDLVGWTTFSDGRDPEEARAVLSDYFDLCTEVVARYGGTVEKFIGDAVMAMWGAPVAREDDAERAVRAALEILSAVSGLADGQIKARAGVCTGEASVLLQAQGQGMVAGDSVNTASRLQSIADPGTVLVDDTTRGVTNLSIAYEAAGEVALKGKDQPVVVWRASRVIGSIGGRKADPLEPPFTGREEELRIIKDLLHAVGREKRPRSISVVGIGGIGKSRMIWELYKYVDGLAETVLWHEGRSPAYGDGIAFWALAEIVRMRAGIAESDDTPTAREKLKGCLAEFVLDAADASWIEAALLHLLAIEEDPDARSEELFAAWRTFFERVAEQETTVLVFEDLQWADSGLLDFIDHLITWAKNSPILVLTLSRPELHDKRPDWGAGQRNFLSIHLDPLADEEITALLKGVVPDLPMHVIEQIMKRSEGVPLYAVEMIRMLMGTGQVAQKGSSLRVVGDIERIDIPDSLHSLIAARLDALPPDARTVVFDASVLGKSFTVDAVLAVSGLDADQIRGQLDDLVRRDILQLEQDPRSPERGQYSFVQSLIREVAYPILSRSDRRDRHIRAAEYFERSEALELADVVATHWLEAYRLATDEAVAEQIADKARTTLVEAADRAASLGSTEQALLLYEKAVSITMDREARADLLLRAGGTARDAAQPEKAVDHLKAAIELMEPSSTNQNAARASLGSAYFLTGQLDVAEDLLRSVAEQNTDPLADPSLPSLYGMLSRICLFKGDIEEAKRWCEEALEWAERHDDVRALVDALTSRGVIAIFAGRSREALATLQGSRQLAESNGLIGEQIRASINISAAGTDVGPRLVEETFWEASELCRRYGIRTGELYAGSNALEAAAHTADWDKYEEIRQRLAPDELQGSPRALLSLGLLMYASYRGDLGTARQELSIMETEFQDSSSVQDHLTVVMGRMTIALPSGEWEEALGSLDLSLGERFVSSTFYSLASRLALWTGDLETLQRVVGIYEVLGPRGGWAGARWLTMKAGLEALTGNRVTADAMYDQALRAWSDLSIPVDRAFCIVDRLVALGFDGGDGGTDVLSARSDFETWGNSYMVSRIDELLS